MLIGMGALSNERVHSIYTYDYRLQQCAQDSTIRFNYHIIFPRVDTEPFVLGVSQSEENRVCLATHLIGNFTRLSESFNVFFFCITN